MKSEKKLFYEIHHVHALWNVPDYDEYRGKDQLNNSWQRDQLET